MFAPYNVFFILLSYLLLLFGIAWVAERQERRGRSLVNNPYVYSLSLAVYCTSWTFYGSVGRAATSGLSFLTIYLGPTLMAALWMVVLARIVRIAKANRITTISDFLGFRYGKSLLLSGLVAAVAVIGVIPYIGLQIKAIISTFEIISHEPRGGAAMGLVITLFLGGFAIIFGARRLDSSERHGGLVFAVAFESLVKLVAFLLVGVFVTYGVFDGFGDIFARIDRTPFAGLQSLEGGGATAYSEWFALLVLSMMAILFLPRQFQMAVVENCDERHLKKAAWLFPLYLFLINIFVLPIAFAGLLLTGSERGADYFVLSIPLGAGDEVPLADGLSRRLLGGDEHGHRRVPRAEHDGDEQHRDAGADRVPRAPALPGDHPGHQAGRSSSPWSTSATSSPSRSGSSTASWTSA